MDEWSYSRALYTPPGRQHAHSHMATRCLSSSPLVPIRQCVLLCHPQVCLVVPPSSVHTHIHTAAAVCMRLCSSVVDITHTVHYNQLLNLIHLRWFLPSLREVNQGAYWLGWDTFPLGGKGGGGFALLLLYSSTQSSGSSGQAYLSTCNHTHSTFIYGCVLYYSW